jgi:DNA-binding response OmpR family regulator
VWIDDDNDLLQSVVEPLRWEGHRVECLRTVQEAHVQLALIREADLLLLDMILPTGLEDEKPPSQSHYTGVLLLKELRHIGVHTPAIVLTVVSPSDQDIPSKDLGVVRIMRKPVLPSELKDAVNRVLETRRPV